MKKIIFMGTPEFSVNVLNMLIDEHYEILAVVTQPDKPVGRKKIITPTPVKELALTYDLPVYQPVKLSNSPELEELLAMEADLIVTAAYGQFLPKRLLESPKFGAVNVHASLLPKYRGGAPIQYAIMNGDEETGVTIMQMISKMDAGDIYSQAKLPILPTDNVQSVFEKLSVLGSQLLKETLPKLFQNELTPIPQDENLVTFSPNIKREEEQINWNMTAQQVDCLIRALSPWPGAYTILQDSRVKIWESTPSSETQEYPVGTLFVNEKKQLLVSCGEKTALEVQVIQPAGKGKMSAKEFQNGFKHLLSELPVFEDMYHG